MTRVRVLVAVTVVTALVAAAPIGAVETSDTKRVSRSIDVGGAAVAMSPEICSVASTPVRNIPKPTAGTRYLRAEDVPPFVRSASEANLKRFSARRTSASFSHSKASAEARGWRPTGVVMHREIGRNLHKSVAGMMRASLVGGQTFNEGSSEGQMWAFSYDDGNSDTWEGIISIHNYNGDEIADFEVQFHVDYPDNVYVGELTYYDGGTRFPGDGPYEYLEASQSRRAVMPKAQLYRAGLRLAQTSRSRSRCLRVCAKAKMVNAGVATLGACGGFAFACGGSGPMYFFCLGSTCSGSAILAYGSVLFTLDECEVNCG